VAHLRANAVMVKDHTAFKVDWMLSGGSDNASLSPDGILYPMEETIKEKLVVI